MENITTLRQAIDRQVNSFETEHADLVQTVSDLQGQLLRASSGDLEYRRSLWLRQRVILKKISNNRKVHKEVIGKMVCTS